MQRLFGLLASMLLGAASSAYAQFGVPWQHVPDTVVISATDSDPRLALVDEALAFWNRILEEVGSGFRIGPVTRLVQTPAEEDLQALSELVLKGPVAPGSVPAGLRGLPGDLRVVLGNTEFVSFAGPFDPDRRRIVGIRGVNSAPLNLPNVARNVIAHEIGHAIGLGHNSDFSLLMCGRPAQCRPPNFESGHPRIFPVSATEKEQLLRLYPAAWAPRSR